jgi:Tol biopolymer transport system component
MHHSPSGRPGHTTAGAPRHLRQLIAGAGTLLAAGALAGPAQAAFPGTNGRVVYEKTPNQLERAYDSTDRTELWTSNASGGDLKLLASFNDRSYPEASAHDPSVSPNGKSVAYVESGTIDSSDPYYDAIHIVGIDGSGDHLLRDDISDGTAPAWSPDGKQIVYVEGAPHLQFGRTAAVAAQGQRLVVAKVDGSGGSTAIDTGDLGAPDDPQWSPDGKWIAFDSASSVYVVPVGGGKPVLVGDHAGNESDSYPNWAPDGTAIIFQRNNYGEVRAARAQSDYGSQFIEVPFEHGAPVNSSEVRVVGTDGWPERPVYSPDGLKLLYAGYGSGTTPTRQLAGVQVNYGLLLAGADGSSPHSFVSPAGNYWLTAADWAPIPKPKPTPQPPTPTPVVVTPAPPGAVQGETAHRCGSRRDFVIRLRPKGVKLAMARVVLRGKRIKVHRRNGRYVAVVNLRTLPKKRFKVDITVWTTAGVRYHEMRRYWTCTPAR